MTSSYNDSVMSFDLGYLQQSSSNTDISKILKCHRNIAKIKSKMIGLDIMYTRNKEQSEIIESTSKSLFASKEECKKLCIDYKNVVEKCENLENDIKNLQIHNQQLLHKLSDAENQYCGMQSLARQLEVLAKEREIQIESLTLENNLEKANSKKIAADASSLEKRNKHILQDLCLLGKFLLGNHRLPLSLREILNKYSKYLKDESENSCHDSNDDLSDNDNEVLDKDLKVQNHDIKKTENHTSIEIQDMIVVNLHSTEKENTSNYKLDETDRYSDCSNEIASADTGRGSSLAFSDSEKCFLSPDSFLIDNHDSPEMISKPKGTSPKRVIETMDIATSPLRIETPIIPIITIDKAVGSDESINIEDVSQNYFASEIRPRPMQVIETMDIATSPFRIGTQIIPKVTIDKAIGTDEAINIENVSKHENCCVSEIRLHPKRVFEAIDIATSPLRNETPIIPIVTKHKEVGRDKSISIQNEPSQPNCFESDIRPRSILRDASIQHDKNSQVTDIQNRTLQVYSSNPNVEEDNSGNYEVEMILRDMTFNRELITPIPSSPSNSRSSVLSDVPGSRADHYDIATMCKQIKILTANQVQLMKAFADLSKQNNNSTHIKNISNVDIDTSIFGNIDLEEREEILNENNRTDKVIESHNNTKETDERNHVQHCAETIQLQTENETDSDDLINMADLQLCHPENLPFDDFSMNNDRELLNDEDITDSLTINSQEEDPINTIEEPEHSSERIVSRLEFEDDTIYASATQPSNLNNEIYESSDKTTVGNCPPATKILNGNERNRRKMSRLNNLERLRRKMVPTCKIQREKLIARRPRVQKHISSRRLIAKVPKKKITAADSSASLNDKTVYDNAVKIMSEFKSKRSRELLNKTLIKSNQAKKVKNIRLLKPKFGETNYKSAKERSDFTKLSHEKLPTVSTEKPFDISELMSKLSQKPIIKSLLPADSPNKSTENKNGIDLPKVKNNQCLKVMQPVILVDRLQENHGRETLCDKIIHSNNINISKSPSPSVNTRSRGRCVVNVESSTAQDIISTKESRKRLKRMSSDDNQDIEHKRILRSSTRQLNFDDSLNCEISSDNLTDLSKKESTHLKSPKQQKKCSEDTNNFVIDNVLETTHKAMDHNITISYDDLDMFDETVIKRPERTDVIHDNPKNSILCTMLEKFSLNKVNFFPKKISDHVTNSILKLIEEKLEIISKLPPNETRTAMDDLVAKLQPCKWKDFTAAFMKYLQNPQRKVELYSKVNSPPAPPMTKYEQILLYVLIKLRTVWPEVDIVNSVLCQMEYILFRINQTPDFDVIESMSHFYAAVCRCFGMKIRLRSFMLDAMYCLQFKAIAVVKQCIDVWMHIIPLAHMGIAKNPLVTCVVYLLHFYKCEDHFNRVQDIRNILHRKYFYEMSEWNETRILETIRNAIYEVIGMPEEKKILRRALLVLAKRQGPRWCQKNIIMNMLLPIIEKKNSSENVKLFCIWMLGPLIKPYPPDMKVHCEIVMNTLLDIAKQKPSPLMQEAVFSSLIYMSKHNQTRVISALLSWHPKHKVSSEFHAVLRDYVREKPAQAWKKALSKGHLARFEDTLEQD